MILIIKQNKENKKNKEIINTIEIDNISEENLKKIKFFIQKDNRIETRKIIVGRVILDNIRFYGEGKRILGNDYTNHIEYYINEILKENQIEFHYFKEKFLEKNLIANTKKNEYYMYIYKGNFNDPNVRNKMGFEMISLYAQYLHNEISRDSEIMDSILFDY